MVRSSPNSRIRKVLAVSRDVSRLSSRANLLTQAGYTADLVVTADQAVRRAAVGHYHLAIVSSTFTYDEQLAIRANLQRVRPSLLVLLLKAEHDAPEAFLAAVASYLVRKKPPEIDPHLRLGRSDELADS